MNKRLVPLLVGVSTTLVAGCGASGHADIDGGRTPRETPASHPSAAPWPAYEVDDYTYTLRTACFCADGGVPVIVTVRDGEAVGAVYAHRGRGHAAGDDAGDWMRVSINDIIDAANNENAAQVRVRWPQGQDHPTTVWVDRDANMADDEIGYSIRDVTLA